MTMQLDGVAESQAEYPAVVDYDYEHEHRFAEHDGKLEPGVEFTRFVGLFSSTCERLLEIDQDVTDWKSNWPPKPKTKSDPGDQVSASPFFASQGRSTLHGNTRWDLLPTIATFWM